MRDEYDYSTHECLDRTFLVMEMLSYVMDHPKIQGHPEWSKLTDDEHTALYTLYQSIGATAPVDSVKSGEDG